MSDYIEKVKSNRHRVQSGQSVTEKVFFVCESDGKTIAATGPRSGFTVAFNPPSFILRPVAGSRHVEMVVTITRTTAAPGATCQLTFTMNGSGADITKDHPID